MDRAVKTCSIRRAQSQRHSVHSRSLFQAKGATWEECTHAILYLPKSRGRDFWQDELIKNTFVAAPMKDADRMFTARTDHTDKARIFEYICFLRSESFRGDVR